MELPGASSPAKAFHQPAIHKNHKIIYCMKRGDLGNVAPDRLPNGPSELPPARGNASIAEPAKFRSPIMATRGCSHCSQSPCTGEIDWRGHATGDYL